MRLPLPRNAGAWVTPARRVAALLHNGHLQARRPFRMVFTQPGNHPVGVIGLVALWHGQQAIPSNSAVINRERLAPRDPQRFTAVEPPVESRRLVVWISAWILGFQGGTLVLNLIHCSVLSWLYLRRYGLELVVAADRLEQQRPPQGVGLVVAGGAQISQAQPQAPRSADQSPPKQPDPRPVPLDPTEVFCNRPRNRVDIAVWSEAEHPRPAASAAHAVTLP